MIRNMLKTQSKLLIGLLVGLISVGCTSVQQQPSNQVEISASRFIDLPLPQQLNRDLTASQLISATWRGETHQLPVQLVVDKNQVVLVGFSSWGTRILSLVYSEDRIDSEVLAGLGVSLPDPKQVLLYVMLTLWPHETWQAKLAPINWQLLEEKPELEGHWRRVLLDERGKPVVTIDYQSPDKLTGTIQIENKLSDYKIAIQTLSSTIAEH